MSLNAFADRATALRLKFPHVGQGLIADYFGDLCNRNPNAGTITHKFEKGPRARDLSCCGHGTQNAMKGTRAAQSVNTLGVEKVGGESTKMRAKAAPDTGFYCGCVNARGIS